MHVVERKKGCFSPLLQSFLDTQYFSYIDCAIAQKYASEESEEAFIAYLSLALRMGHLCIDVQNGQISPAISTLDLTENGVENFLEDELLAAIQKGAQTVNKPVVRTGSKYYFKRFFELENQFLSDLERLEKNTPTLSLNVEESVAELLKEGKLLAEQADAILKASQQSLTIICGGPGTGKTYTAGHLIRLFYSRMSENDADQCKIVLAAPTGKAAANLQSSLQRAMGNSVEGLTFKGQTLHALLGVRGDGQLKIDAPTEIDAQIIVIDESSMIDLAMMVRLFQLVRSGSRLILLGDKCQLPPVEAGSLFADLMESRPLFSVELKRCMRSELQGILELAASIRDERADDALRLLNEGNGVKRCELTENELLLAAFERFPKGIVNDPNELFKSYQKFRVLSSLRKGALGVDALNAKWHQMMLKKGGANGIVEPIIVTSSDPRLELFNGETGVLVRRGAEEIGEGDYALFQKEEQIRKIPALLLPSFEYAYCLSVHKSQGSEFDHVLFLMPQGSEYFGREVLYTAVTRAKKELEIWGDEKLLRETIARSSRRLSGIKSKG